MFRFFPNWRPFDHGLTVPPLMRKEEAALLVGQLDKATTDKLILGHIALVVDVVGRALAKHDLPGVQGEELLAVGLEALCKAVPRLTSKVRNVRAYLSKSVKNGISDFLENGNSLCHVPSRTRRDRARKGKESVTAPKIKNVTDLANAEISSNEADCILSGLQKKPCETKLNTIQDVYQFCADEADKAVCRLSWAGGDGPRALDEVAALVGLALDDVRDRLNRIEDKIYIATRKKKPAKKRAPGKRFFPLEAETCRSL